MDRLELAGKIQEAYKTAAQHNAAVHVTEVTDLAPGDETGYGTFSVHVGGLDADIFHIHVYKE